ncbi:MAG: FAD-dependent oxidoreductase [Acidimicrobiia bacterium]
MREGNGLRQPWWWTDGGGGSEPPLPLPPDAGPFDVVIVGTDLAALWTAHLLLVRRPTLRIAVLAATPGGPGAGVDGTGCSSPLPGLLAVDGGDVEVPAGFADRADRAAAALVAAGVPLGEVRWRRGPSVALAEDRPELARCGLTLRNARRNGLAEDRLAWLEPVPGIRRPALHGVLGMLWSGDGLALHPGWAARLLRRALVDAGVTMAEVGDVQPRTGTGTGTGDGVVADGQAVAAAAVVCAGYPAVAGLAPPVAEGLQPTRWWHVVSEPIDDLTWGRLGWPVRQVVVLHGERGDVQAQHEPGGRLVWSWRPPAGARPRARLRAVAGLDRRDPRDPVAALRRSLTDRLPAGVEVTVAHHWAQDVATAGGVGRDPASGSWWVVAERDDPLSTFERAAQLADRLPLP